MAATEERVKARRSRIFTFIVIVAVRPTATRAPDSALWQEPGTRLMSRCIKVFNERSDCGD
jgi:hypothetical protein